jgi:23S rRNA pseudouridine2604 synthase
MNSIRINKYLAEHQYASRRKADELITAGKVFINGKKAVLGDTVTESDKIEVKLTGKEPSAVYYAYYKPEGVVTHSPQNDDIDIKTAIRSQLKSTERSLHLFPIGRLDKDSHGLLILTNDGRITSKLLDPDQYHEKEYIVETKERLPIDFDMRMERGVIIEDGNSMKFKTKPCIVHILGERKFSIILTEGKKRQIRRMTESIGPHVVDLKRIRIMSIQLGYQSPNTLRKLKGEELERFLKELGVHASPVATLPTKTLSVSATKKKRIKK